LTAEFPDHWPVTTLASAPPVPNRSDREIVEAALDDPVGRPRLEDQAEPGRQAVIVTGDISRLWQKPSVLVSAVIDRLSGAGVRDEDITVLVATGTHRPHTEKQHRVVVGDDVYERVRVVSHDCRDHGSLAEVGRGTTGAPVLVNRLIVEADLAITTGAVTFHTLSGFSGGPKSIIPGVAGYETIQANHRLCLDRRGRLLESVHHGAIDGNPVAEDMAAAAALVRVDFGLNVVVGDGGRYLAARAGDPAVIHRDLGESAKRFFEVPLDEPADLVAANVGGHPRDAELFQSIKALGQAAEAARDQGTIILSAACDTGAGPEEWLGWFRLGGREGLVEQLLKDFTIPGFVALKVHDIAARHRIILVSELDEAVVKLCRMEPAETLDQALEMASADAAPGRVIWMPAAATTVPVIGRVSTSTGSFS
jgi:nickel-dependent lactate racemase